MISEEEADDIKRRHSASLRSLPGVLGIGIGKGSSGEPVLTVYLNRRLPRPPVPDEIEGLRIQTIDSDPFEKQRFPNDTKMI